MATLTLSSGTLQQSSFDKVGDGFRYDKIKLLKGFYIAARPYQLNSGTTITSDPGAIITLTAGVSETLFPSMVPIFGQVENYISDILIENITFRGNRRSQKVAHGKGFHNLVGIRGGKNITIRNVTAGESQGDIARIVDCENVLYSGNIIKECGHDGLFVERCVNVEAAGNVTYTRVNSALRSKGSSNVSFHDNFIYGTSEAYSPGIQVENSKADELSSGIEIWNNHIEGTYGPGIWAACHTSSNIKAASDLNIHDNVISNCGTMPVENGIPGLGGIVCDGWDRVNIENNIIDSCKGYGVLFGRYLTTSAGKGYTATVKNNTITNTQKPNSTVATSGTAIANLIPDKYTIFVEGNKLSRNVKDYSGVAPATSAGEYEIVFSCSSREEALARLEWIKSAFIREV